MNRDRLQEYIDKFENMIWSAKFVLIKLLKKQEYTLVSRNKQFENIHKGETCFILGNGPSLKYETRLEELSNYTVFSVNQFYRSELFEIIRPQYHVMVDPLFFKLKSEDASELDTLLRMRQIAADERIQMILPVDAYKYVKEQMGDSSNYIFVKNRFKMCENYHRPISMAEFIPASRNVVQTAIYCAIYMGFKRIVILGCDMTGLLDNYVKRKPGGPEEKFSHIYEYTNEEKERMKRVHAEHSNELMLTGFATMFRDFRLINNVCKEKGIELLNATQETALDMLKYSELNLILDELGEII